MKKEVLIEKIDMDSSVLKLSEIDMSVSAKGKQTLKFQFTPPKEKGLYLFSIDIKFLSIKMPIRAYATIEIK